MQQRDPWKTWHKGDLVSNGYEQGEIVSTTFTTARGTKLPRVKILTGRRTGLHVWPWEQPRWTVALDYEPKTVRLRCNECDRQFWAPQRQSRCRECVRKEEAEDALKSSTNTGSRTFSRLGAAPAFTPAPVQSSATEEERARVDRGRVAGGDEPF